jgi:hypothetical protein
MKNGSLCKPDLEIRDWRDSEYADAVVMMKAVKPSV